jgi:hypothetical protein
MELLNAGRVVPQWNENDELVITIYPMMPTDTKLHGFGMVPFNLAKAFIASSLDKSSIC